MSKQEIIIQNNCLFQLISLLLFHLRYTPYLALAPKRTVPSLNTFVYECITQYLNHRVILLHVHQLQLLNTMNCHFFRSIYNKKTHLIYLPLYYFIAFGIWMFCLQVICVLHSVPSAEARRGHWNSWHWITDGCEPSRECWDSNAGPLE